MVGGAMCASDIADRPMFIEAMMGATFVEPDRLPDDRHDWDAVDVSRGAALRAVRAEGREARAEVTPR